MKDPNIRIRARLVRDLQLAFSGELGAAIAYRGHAASVADPDDRRRIADIRREELDHRDWVGHALDALDARPDRLLELRSRCLGASIALFCHVGGWFLPMYGAGWLESRNLGDYERAARLSAQCGRADLADGLLRLAEVEWEHERYFRLKAASHPFARILKVWPAPPPKAEIRRRFERFRDADYLRRSSGRLEPSAGFGLEPPDRGLAGPLGPSWSRGGDAGCAAVRPDPPLAGCGVAAEAGPEARGVAVAAAGVEVDAAASPGPRPARVSAAVGPTAALASAVDGPRPGPGLGSRGRPGWEPAASGARAGADVGGSCGD